MKKLQITMVISSLTAGGAERVLSNMANYWAGLDWEINILTLCGAGSPPFYPLDARIRWIPLDVMGESPGPITALAGNLRRIGRLHIAIRKTCPDLVISFLGTTNVLVLLATRGLNFPVVISERSDPAREKLGTAWEMLRRWTYPWASALVAQHGEVGEFFEKIMPGRVRLIPNPVFPPECGSEISNQVPEGSLIIGVGRFTREKGFHLLIQAFDRLKARFPDWKLVILGDGPMRLELENLVSDLGLTGWVLLPGNARNPGATLALASLFVMPSLYEGFPNALCEAMACGLASAAANCSGGVREIIQDGVNGILFPPGDVEGMAGAMGSLMADPQQRAHLGLAAKSVTDRFSQERVMGMWETMLRELIGKGFE